MFKDPTPMHFEKLAADVQLPEDPNTWTQEVHQELYKQVSYISDFDAHIVMAKVDAEQAYGFGHIEVSPKTSIQPSPSEPNRMSDAGVNVARIPIIIKNRQLKPLDTLIMADSSMAPLTESRLRRALFRPQTFDMAARSPGDTSMLGSLFPPTRQSHGFGGAGGVSGVGMGKFGGMYDGYDGYAPSDYNKGSAAAAPVKVDPKILERIAHDVHIALHPVTKQASVLMHILPTIHAADFSKFAHALGQNKLADAYDANPATHASTHILQNFKDQSSGVDGDTLNWDMKTASVIQISKQGGGMYQVKVASNKCWQPKVELMTRGDIYKFAGAEATKDVDMHGSVTMGRNSVEQPGNEKDEYQLVDKAGTWKVQSTTGEELVGYCFTNLLDTEGSPMPISMFTNGSASAVQGEIAGVQVSSGANLPTGKPSGYGFWSRYLPNGTVEATIPMKLGTRITDEGGEGFMAETYSGKKVTLRVQPHIRQVCGIGDKMLVPDRFAWVPLNGQSVSLVSNPAEMGKSKTAQAQALHMLSEVTLRGGGDIFSLEGHPISKLAYAQKNDLNIDDTIFLLTGLGVKPEDAIEKMAETNSYQRPVQVHVSGSVHTSDDAWRQAVEKTASFAAKYNIEPLDLWKEAAVIPDPTAVDTVLSLGFINPENINAFIEALPVIDRAQSKMVDLLMGVRLGIRDVPEGALERAIKNSEEVIEGLKVIAFSQN